MPARIGRILRATKVSLLDSVESFRNARPSTCSSPFQRIWYRPSRLMIANPFSSVWKIGPTAFFSSARVR